MTTTETTFRKTFHGNLAETTYKNVAGYDWKITTMKRSSGIISTHAQAGAAPSDNTFTFTMFSDPSLTLVSQKGMATEKVLREIHLKGLAIFDQMKEAGTLPGSDKKPYQIEEGQILFLNGYGQDEYHHERKAVYKITKNEWGTKYHTVNLETLVLGIHDHVKNITEKFGIGTYYKEGDKISAEELGNYMIDATQKATADNRKKESEGILNEQLRNAKIEEGKKIVKIPEGAKTIIVGEFKTDESDSMTDYYGHTTTKVIYLAFSNHKRNIFSELRKAALNSEKTKFLFDSPESYENRENYTGGNGYYLGERRNSGWEINKAYLDISHPETLNKLYIAAAEGRYFASTQEAESAPVIESVKIEGLELVKYSEKAVALFGNTKPLKDDLKAIGGKFNAYLTNPTTGQKQAGWIFQISKEDAIKKLLNKGGI